MRRNVSKKVKNGTFVRFNEGILLALSTIILGGAIIGVGSQTANSSEQFARIHRVVSNDVDSSVPGVDERDPNVVQVGDELVGKTIWFKFSLFNEKKPFSTYPSSANNFLNFNITGDLNIKSIDGKNYELTNYYNSFCLSYGSTGNGYRRFYLPDAYISNGNYRSYISFADFNNEILKASYGVEESFYDEWISITFKNKDELTTDFDGHDFSFNSLSIKVTEFSNYALKNENCFFYSIPKEEPKFCSFNNNLSTIYKSKNSILTIDDVINKAEFKDYKSLKVVNDEYSGNGNKAGQYEITFEIKDDFKTTKKSVNIVVSNKELPNAVWHYNGYVNGTTAIRIESNEQLKISKSDIISIISYSENLYDDLAIFTFEDPNNALKQTDKEGNYNLSCHMSVSNGSSKNFNLELIIADKDSGTIVDKRLNVWQKMCKFFSDIGNNIKNFFVWLWNHTIGAIINFFKGKN